MSENHVQRLIVVLLALFISLAMIFSPVLEKLFHPGEHVTQWLNLKPGIDMVGGTSLTYHIKQPEGGYHGTDNLAEKVMVALKKRVDPQGIKNLIWRPQGNDRLEIQMPFSGGTRANAELRKQVAEELSGARAQLDSTNVTLAQVQDAVEQKNGHARKELQQLASGDPTRAAYFQKLTDAWDKLQAAHQKQDADLEARFRTEYQKLLSPPTVEGEPAVDPLASTNLRTDELDSVLAGPAEDRQKELGDLKSRFANVPARLAAIDRYVKAFDAHAKLKESLDDSEDLKRLLRGSGVLEFHILVEPSTLSGEDAAQYQKLVQRLHTQGPRVEAGDTMRWYVVDKAEEFKHADVVQQYNHKSYVLAWTTTDKSLDNRPGQPKWALRSAFPTITSNNEQVVAFNMDPQGGVLMGELTAANMHHPMAIVLDGKVISAPTINGHITESGTIDGGGDGFSRTELEYLVNTLTAGSLPAQLDEEPISERTVGSTLGEDNLRHGLTACGLGLVVVAVFLCSYYYTAGAVATFAVLMNVILILGTMAALNATFTLPSIAGIVLTIGTAVDANVLIFERLREEQHRGLSLRLALRNAYGKAFSAIVDSNMTTVITSIFLIWFGTEEVKGFGITLIIGIIASLFTALFVTRTIFDILIDYFGVTRLSSLPLTYPKWDRLLRPNIDWMRMVWGFVAFSAIAIVIGLVMFVQKARAGELLDIEFASGTSVQLELKQPMQIADLRKLVDQADPVALPSPSIVSVDAGGGQRQGTVYEIITPNANSTQVKDAVLKALGGRIQAVLPSKFDSSGADSQVALKNNAIRPLTAQTVGNGGAWPGGAAPKASQNNLGGVAIVLEHLDPPLAPSTIRTRIVEQQLQADTAQQVAQREFVVESPAGGDAPTSSAVVIAKDEALPYEKDKEQWQTQLAAPMWRLVNDAIGRPAQLQQVKNFDAAVAGDTQQDAFLALTLSVLVIMAYIWLRFGNLKYGTATVVALLHDTIFVVAAIGLSHYLVLIPGLKQLLALEPFRINLTVVAGILTIMGYSMIDTIVVFDRIRENRGKFGLVSRRVINDAVNQTLSRTLLTAGTTTMTVAIMYFFGGPGIHGFTFVLLVGILVGTYSSVAIAAPILLVGNKQESDTSGNRLTGQLQKAGV